MNDAETDTTICPPRYTLSRVLLNSLLSKEAELQKQPKMRILSVTERKREVFWMISIGRRFHLGMSTVGLSIFLFDRITSSNVQRKYLNCVSITCLVLAVKFCEEVDYSTEVYEANRETAMSLAIPSPVSLNADELASHIKANTFYSQKELMRMERLLLEKLKWELAVLPSFDRFLTEMLAVINLPHLSGSIILRQNFELVVSSELPLSYSSSALALAILSIMLEVSLLEWGRITHSLSQIFQISEFELAACRIDTIELIHDHYWANNSRHVNYVRPNRPLLQNRLQQRKRRKRHVMDANVNVNRRPKFFALEEVQELSLREM